MSCDLEAFRRRFILDLVERENILRDRNGETVERRVAVEAFDLDRGSFTYRPGYESLGGRGEAVSIEIALETLAIAWPALVQGGCATLGLVQDVSEAPRDEDVVATYLLILLDEILESTPFEANEHLALTRSGGFATGPTE